MLGLALLEGFISAWPLPWLLTFAQTNKQSTDETNIGAVVQPTTQRMAPNDSKHSAQTVEESSRESFKRDILQPAGSSSSTLRGSGRS